MNKWAAAAAYRLRVTVFSRNDLAGFVEAHDASAERFYIGLACAFFPAAPLEIGTDEGLAVRFADRREEILKGASPQGHALVIAERVDNLLMVEVESIHNGPEMIAHHFLEMKRSIIAAEEFDEPAQVQMYAVMFCPCEAMVGSIGRVWRFHRHGRDRLCDPFSHGFVLC